MTHCVNCGQGLDSDSRFCAHCGGPVSGVGAAQAVPPSASAPPAQPVPGSDSVRPQSFSSSPGSQAPPPPTGGSQGGLGQGVQTPYPASGDANKKPSKSLIALGSALAGVLVLGVLGVVIFGIGGKDTRLIDAHEDCKDEDFVFALLYSTVSEDGTSLFMDGAGEDSLGVNYSYQACVLKNLDVPSAVVSRMDNTSSLMGLQTANWDGILASWTYHPRNGFDVYLELQ